MTSWKSSITLRAPSIGNERKSSDYTQTSGDCILPRIGAYEVPVASTEGRKSDRPDQSRSTRTPTERSSSRKATGLSPRRLQLDPWGECQVPPCTPASALEGSQGFTCTTTQVIKAAIEIEKGSPDGKARPSW